MFPRINYAQLFCVVSQTTMYQHWYNRRERSVRHLHQTACLLSQLAMDAWKEGGMEGSHSKDQKRNNERVSSGQDCAKAEGNDGHVIPPCYRLCG